MGVAPAPSRTAAQSGPPGPDRTHWLRVARETADDLATDAVAREQAGKAPFDEVSRLREAGLLTLLIPAEHGGGGADWATACAVLREIAAADAAIGQLLGCHYVMAYGARLFAEPGLAARVERRSAAELWCWGGGVARQEPRLTLVPSGDGYVLNGRQSYVTGVLVADRLAVRAVRADTGEPLAVIADTSGRGVRIDDDADPFGQRLAAGGSVEFDGVRLGVDEVLGSLSADEDVLSPAASLAAPLGRLVSVQLRLGIAEGVLGEAREYSRAGHAPWQTEWPAGSPQDPQTLAAYGELTVLTRSASALAAEALTALEGGLRRGADLTYDECAEISILVAVAEAAASRAAHESTARALDIVGARSASARLGLDRFWRNARTHTLYEPVAHRLRDIGDYFLNGAHPPFTLPV
ncbi:acyl-CoA dehydrogenase family protein [Streptomyces cinnabarinus]|uniref:Acyl-CoA dehydrogenase family protein n=1 Tax=Streptomyces cinnabarinus TaxID=67287 RepID=A0ABY7K780_9ACTN|nr:acyl-CoA dehydrogenase family protein [Streptomyces cinnabarinus]WAZ19398.1 acyl-CoA dehydrogenase family protein [Streptomyces cinnabarinus]